MLSTGHRTVLIWFIGFLLANFAANVRIQKVSNSGPTKYFVVFSSRSVDPVNRSLAGHAFVAWGIESSVGQFSWQTAYGYYPVKGIGILGSVPGNVKIEDLIHSVHHADQSLMVEVSKESFDASEKIRMSWADHDPGYKLAYSDCVTFTDSIARSVGLSTPKDRSETVFPQAYIHQLVQLNEPDPLLNDPLVRKMVSVINTYSSGRTAEINKVNVVGQSAMQQLNHGNAMNSQNNLSNAQRGIGGPPSPGVSSGPTRNRLVPRRT